MDNLIWISAAFLVVVFAGTLFFVWLYLRLPKRKPIATLKSKADEKQAQPATLALVDAPPAEPPPHYVQLTQQGTGKIYELDSSLATSVSLGREKEKNQIVIDDPTASLVHASIYYDPRIGAICIEDRDSLNGVYLNGGPTRKNILEDGAVLEIGTQKFAFQDTGYIHPLPAAPRS